AGDGGSGDLAVAEENLREKRLTVQRMGNGLADTDLLQDGPLQVEAHGHDAVRAAWMVTSPDCPKARVARYAAQQGPGQLPQEIRLAILEGEDLHPHIWNDGHDERIRVRQPRLEVGRIAGEPDLRPLRVGHELERAGADGAAVRRIGLRVATLIELPRDDRRLCRVQLVQQRRIRLLEAEDHG